MDTLDKIKKYFTARRGRVVPHPVEGNRRPSMPWKRVYYAKITQVSNNELTADISADDYDQSGRKLTGAPVKMSSASVSLEGLQDPAHVLDMLVRKVDRRFMASFKVRDVKVEDVNPLEKKLQALISPEDRAPGDAPPQEDSIQRVRDYFKAEGNLIIPEFYASQEGIVRARWQHGASFTLWVNFPGKGGLGWTLSFPRVGDHGLLRVSGKCAEDKDIVPVMEKFGIAMKH